MGYYRYGGIFVPQSTNNGFAEEIELQNLCDPTQGEIGLLSSSTGVINANQTGCYTSDYIPCQSGQIFSAGYINSYVFNPLIVSSWREYCATYCFYSTDNSFLSGGSISRTEMSASGVIVPNNAKYVRVSWSPYGGSDYFKPTETPEKCYVTLGDKTPDNPKPYSFNPSYTVNLDDNDFYGKTLCVFGDSYSDSWGGHSWDAVDITQKSQGGNAENNTAWTGKLFWSKVCSELGLKLDNRAKGGSNLCKGSSSYEDYNGIDKIDNLVAEVKAGATPPDYIVIQYGTNAWESQITTVDDTSTSTYAGGLKYFIDTIHENMPDCKIGVMLPLTCNDYPHRFNAHDIMIEVLQLDDYKVPYVDMAEISGLVKSDLPDGVHPASEKANKAYARGARTLLMLAA